MAIKSADSAIIDLVQPYGGPEGPCQTHVYKFNIFKLIFSEPDVSNLEISKLDISKFSRIGFVPLLALIVLMVKLWPWLGVCSMHLH